MPIYGWLCQKGECVYLYSGKIYPEQLQLMNLKLVICYNYKYLINREVIQIVQGKIINLHISLLPWNRGSSPNFWSFIEDTPKGVTIHYIDENLDKGSILLKRKFVFEEENESFETTYKKLNDGIKELFYDNWDKIENGQLVGKEAEETGSYHRQEDLEHIRQKMDFTWDENIVDVKRRYKQIFSY